MKKTCYGCIHKDTCSLLANFNRDEEHICLEYQEVRYQNTLASLDGQLNNLENK